MNLLLLVVLGLLLLAAGALLGRFYMPDRRPLKRAAEEGRSYVRGLLGVLDGDNDAAIAELARALRGSDGSVEAYFALGTLFRRRQEYERAVRVHQSILLRRRLPKKDQLKAHLQLARDFQAAGFSRRAVKALEWVVSRDKNNLEGWRGLVTLYQETGRWERAALAYRRLGRIGGDNTGPVQAHIWAQLAANQLKEDDPAAARRSLKRALSAHRDSVHALHVLALLQQQSGNLSAAVKAWQRALRARPELVGFILPRLEGTLFELNKLDKVDNMLDELMNKNPDSVQLRLARARFERRRSPSRALADLERLLEEQPNLLPARRDAARLILEDGDQDRVRGALGDLLDLLGQADRGYRCTACGHAEEQLFWRCPSCGEWDTVRVAWGRRKGESRNS